MKSNDFKFWSVAIFILIIALVAYCSVGRLYIPFFEVLKNFATLFTVPSYEQGIIWHIRLPRGVLAILVGGSLASSGVVLQGVLKNPLASPFVLGVASGAGFGAALAIVLGFSYYMIQISSLFFGNIAVFIALFIALKSKVNGTVSLVLSGMVIGSFFSALISIVKIFASPLRELQDIVFWLMGSLSGATWSKVLYLLPMFFISFTLLHMLSWKLNILAMGDENAMRVGQEVLFTKILIVVLATVLATSSVSVAGVIGWVGLIIPHVVRSVIGSEFKELYKYSFVIGGLFMLVIDLFCRTLFAIEVPIGIITSIVGAPFFLFMLLFKKGSWGV